MDDRSPPASLSPSSGVAEAPTQAVPPEGLDLLSPVLVSYSLPGSVDGPESDFVEAPSFHSVPLRPGEESDDPLADPSTLEAGPDLPPRAPVRGPSIPRFVAGYEVLGVLGRGGMGVVYKARQVGLNRLVALKMIRSPIAGREEQARFRVEAEAVARLQHPNIVQVFEVGEHEGLPFFSLELVEGGSLDTRLSGSPLEPAPAVRLVYTLARAMQAAHDKGIVHRDLKPANILLGPADPAEPGPSMIGGRGSLDLGMPKITDFGLAKCLHEAPGLPTQSGAVLGTPSYMAPEQAQGNARDVEAWTDVYALGAILYELLTGRPPFRAATVLDTLEQVRSQEPVPPRRLQPKVPRDLETVCLKCLEKQPARRYPRAADLADDLWRYLHNEPVQARPAGPVERLVKLARRRPTMAALAAVSLVVLLVLGAAIPWEFAHVQRERDEAKRDGALDRLRASCQQLQREGESALGRGTAAELHVARARFQSVLEQIGPAPSLEDAGLVQLRAEAEGKAAEVRRRLADLAAGEDALQRFDKFFLLRDEAYFLLHRDLVLGAEASPEASRQAARDALALFGLDLDGAGPAPAPDLGRYEPARRERLRTGLYEVALLLAEATARSRPADGKGKADRQWVQTQASRALRVLDRVAAWAPVTQVSRMRRARYLEMQGDGPAAAREREAAEKLKPQTALELFLSAHDKVLLNGDLRAAEADLDAALHLERDLFWARFLHALVSYKTKGAVTARVFLAVCIDQRPQFVYSYLFDATLCIHLKDFNEAAADLARAAELRLDESARYVLLVHRGLLAWAQKQIPRAVNDLRQAVLLKPGEYMGHVNLAGALAEGNDLDGAAAALGEALRLRPDLAELYRTRATLHLRRHDSKAALADYTEAIRLGLGDGPSPALAEDFQERALLRHAAGRTAAAARDCDAALDLKPDLPLAWALKGEILLQQGRPRDALAAFDRYLALAKVPAVKVFHQRARAWAEQGEFVRVPDEYTRALAARPSADLYAARGHAFLVNDALVMARHDFEDALKLSPQHPDALTGRGLLRAIKGDHRAGVADAEEGLRLKPDSSLLRYNAARVLAQAAAAAGADPRLGARAGEVRKDYEGRAVRQLREALERVPPPEQARFWKDKVQRDLILVPLQSCPDFAKLAGKFSAPGP
jgi:serine/threonine protein kinase/predicted Zn-dependent protease